MLTVALQINPQDCIDCAEHAINKDWTPFLTCTLTILVGVVVRFFEKRKIKKDLNK